MSKPITSARFLELCNEWGIKYVPVHSSWASHNRNAKGEWDDLNGVMLHHTGAFSTADSMAETLWNGYAGLPGPLCHAGVDPKGVLRLTGWGRANHAGLGSQSTLELIQNGLRGFSHNIAPGPATVDGNRHFYGFEIIADGVTPMTDSQRITAVRISAALCTEHNWGPDVIGHGEWQQGKWDPGAHGKLIDMSKMREEIQQAIEEGPLPKRVTRTTTVKSGENLHAIALRALGDASRWTEIVALNHQLLRSLHVGETLKLPEK